MGSHQRRIVAARLEGWAPDWSPTGRRIAFTSDVFWDRPAPSLYTVRPDGSGLRRSHIRRSHTRTRGRILPERRKVVFESDRRYDDFCCSDLYVVRLRRKAEEGAPAVRCLRSSVGNGSDAAPDELGPVRDAAFHGRRAAVHLRSGAGGRRSVRLTHS